MSRKSRGRRGSRERRDFAENAEVAKNAKNYSPLPATFAPSAFTGIAWNKIYD